MDTKCIEWCKSVSVPVYKKGDARQCFDYSTIMLIPYVNKVMLHILKDWV